MAANRPERPTETDQAIAAATTAVEQVEGEIRAFVRRDVSVFRRTRPETGSDTAVDSITSVIDRVSGASVTEIERVIAELTTVRDMTSSRPCCRPWPGPCPAVHPRRRGWSG